MTLRNIWKNQDIAFILTNRYPATTAQQLIKNYAGAALVPGSTKGLRERGVILKDLADAIIQHLTKIQVYFLVVGTSSDINVPAFTGIF